MAPGLAFVSCDASMEAETRSHQLQFGHKLLRESWAMAAGTQLVGLLQALGSGKHGVKNAGIGTDGL